MTTDELNKLADTIERVQAEDRSMFEKLTDRQLRSLKRRIHNRWSELSKINHTLFCVFKAYKAWDTDDNLYHAYQNSSDTCFDLFDLEHEITEELNKRANIKLTPTH